MNRRGFIGALSGLVAWAKKPFLVSPAASAIPPTCEKPYRYEVRFITRDGHVTPPSPVTMFQLKSRSITIEGMVPSEIAAGSMIVMSLARGNMEDIPYYHVHVEGWDVMGLKRS